jgi:hypothetical protein
LTTVDRSTEPSEVLDGITWSGCNLRRRAIVIAALYARTDFDIQSINDEPQTEKPARVTTIHSRGNAAPHQAKPPAATAEMDYGEAMREAVKGRDDQFC